MIARVNTRVALTRFADPRVNNRSPNRLTTATVGGNVGKRARGAIVNRYRRILRLARLVR